MRLLHISFALALSVLLSFAASAVASTDTCPALSRTLARGSRGTDVVQLQQFLIAQGSLQAGSATGFFGALTEAGVKSWQLKNSLDSVGIVGPKTRAAVARQCSNLNPNTQTFSASPTSGTGPLLVTFTSILQNSHYSIDYGDGTYTGWVGLKGGGNPDEAGCPPAPTPGLCEFTNTHTYNSGDYTAKLKSSDPPTATAIVKIPTIKIHASQNENLNKDTLGFHATRQSGTTPIWATFIWNLSGNSGSLYDVDFGDDSSCSGYDCVVGNAGPPMDSRNQGMATHKYTAAGTYVARLFGPRHSNLGTATITTVASQQNQQSVTMWVSPTSGKAPLVTKIGWEGDKGIKDFSVDYGDGSRSTSATMKCRFASTVPRSILSRILRLIIPVALANTYITPYCGVDHTYTVPGSYTLRLLAADGTVLGIVQVTAQ